MNTFGLSPAKLSRGFICFVFAVLLVGCRKAPEKTVVRPIETMKVGDFTALEGRDWPCRAKASEEVNLAFRVSGPLSSFPVKVGTEVKGEEVLATIDPRDFEVALRRAEANFSRAEAEFEALKKGARPEEMRQLKLAVTDAEAALARATADYERARKMIAQRVISQEEYDRKEQLYIQTQARLSSAREDLAIGQAGARQEDLDAKAAEIQSLKAEVEDAKNKLEYTTLRAPFGGRISATFVENFETVAANQPVVRLVATSSVEVSVDIPETLMALLPKVDSIVCRFDALGDREFPAAIKEVGIEPSEVTRTYPVTLEVKQPGDLTILPGMSGYVRAKGTPEARAQADSYEIPLTAVRADDDGTSYVWVVDEKNSTVKRRNIAMGTLTDHGVLVKEVKQGDRIATAGVHFLDEGQKVRIESGANDTPKATKANDAATPEKENDQ